MKLYNYRFVPKVVPGSTIISLSLLNQYNYTYLLMVEITEEQKQASRFAKAMSHPVRMYILELLSNQTCCYSGDLSEVLPVAKSTLSQHLKELKKSGLIQGEIEQPKIKYCLDKENWEIAQKLFKKILQI